MLGVFVTCSGMKLLKQVELVGRRMRLAPSTVCAYSSWIRHYLSFCCQRRRQWTHPVQLGTADAEAFLNDLVVRRRLSASSQNQALNALVFLYQRVLENTLPQDHLGKLARLRSRRPKRVPTVLGTAETGRLIDALDPARMSRLMIDCSSRQWREGSSTKSSNLRSPGPYCCRTSLFYNFARDTSRATGRGFPKTSRNFPSRRDRLNCAAQLRLNVRG